MIKTRREVLDSYVQKFWSLISTKIADKGEDVQKILRLNSSEDFDFLLAARNVIEDASLAISHFQRFGLGGATKYDDLGEKYLRLYGLLSATYMQQEAILKILKIMTVDNPQKYKDKFDNLQVRILRHKLVAHGISYHNKVADRHEAYVPLRFELHDTEVTYIGPTGDWTPTTVSLPEAIEAHFDLSIYIMDTIFEKAINTIHRAGNNQKHDAFMEKLHDLRIEKDGGIVVTPEGGPKLIVTFIGNREKKSDSGADSP